MTEKEFIKESKKLWSQISADNQRRMLHWEYCELEYGFYGFIESYNDLPAKLPKDFTIIDLGSYQAVQGLYFKEFKNYIAVDCSVPMSAFLVQDNMQIYPMSGEQFIAFVLPRLQKEGLDLNKTFCVCSYVPDIPLRNELVPATFPYYRTIYCSERHERLPKIN